MKLGVEDELMIETMLWLHPDINRAYSVEGLN